MGREATISRAIPGWWSRQTKEEQQPEVVVKDRHACAAIGRWGKHHELSRARRGDGAANVWVSSIWPRRHTGH